MRYSRSVAGVAWSAWTKIFTSNTCPFFSLGGTVSFCTETSFPRAMPIGTTSTVTPSGRAASTADHGVADVLVAVGHQHQALLAGLGKRRRAQPDRAGDVRPFGADHRLDFPSSTAELAVVSMLASVPKTITPALSDDFLRLGTFG